jgi:hypothetical protein
MGRKTTGLKKIAGLPLKWQLGFFVLKFGLTTHKRFKHGMAKG